MRKAFAALAILVLASGLSGGEPLPDGLPQSNGASQSSLQHSQSPAIVSGKLPVTTSSADARALYESGIVSWENLQLDSALKRWRIGANTDPDFAIAHLMLAYCTPDPVEEKAERQKAESLRHRVTPDERLLIAWFNGVRENNYVEGIAAMNDLLQRYPKDKQLRMLLEFVQAKTAQP